jgi:hypothetical protein
MVVSFLFRFGRTVVFTNWKDTTFFVSRARETGAQENGLRAKPAPSLCDFAPLARAFLLRVYEYGF